MGRLNLSEIDTTPGTDSWAAPAEPVDDYTAWLRDGLKNRLEVSVPLQAAARITLYHPHVSITYLGPHAAEAEEAVSRLAQRMDQKRKQSTPGPSPRR